MRKKQIGSARVTSRMVQWMLQLPTTRHHTAVRRLSGAPKPREKQKTHRVGLCDALELWGLEVWGLGQCFGPAIVTP